MNAPTNIIATEGVAGAGALTYWSLSGTVDPEDLSDAWAAAGLDADRLPSPPSPQVAFSRAVREQTGRHRLVRRAADGYAIVDESVGAASLDYAVSLRVKLDAAGRVQAVGGVAVAGNVAASDANAKTLEQVRADYERHLETLSTEDIAGWLSRLVRLYDGVALRDTGGFYYVPPKHVDGWRAATAALRAVSDHRVFMVPAMRSEEAVEAILAAVQAEADAEAKAIEDELEPPPDGKKPLGARGLESRQKHIDDVEAKVARYEELLGTKLEAFRDRLSTLRAGVAGALLVAMAREEAG